MFTVYGPGVTDPVPLEKLFVRPAVTKLAAMRRVQSTKSSISSGGAQNSAYRTAVGMSQYHAADAPDDRAPALKAGQIMSAPVVSIVSNALASEALALLDESGFRHLPVLSPTSALVGMLSDRDLVHCMCATEGVCLHCSSEEKQHITVAELMSDPVLTASIDTDARHVARLFVEQRIGAIPITDRGELAGMITHSDILRAVMVHFDLDMWS